MKRQSGPAAQGTLLKDGEKLETLSPRCSVITGSGYTFTTDTILLAAFSLPHPGENCADFGTGCGTIPLFWCDRSAPRRVYAVELQESACTLARRSAALNGLEDRIEIVQKNIRALKEERALPFGLDRIACNPPYYPDGAGPHSGKEERRLARHETACSFAEIAAAAAAFLRWGGYFCCCLKPERLCTAMVTLHSAGLEPKRLRLVQQRTDKAPFLFLLQASRGGRPGLTAEPALLLEAPDGSCSEEIRKIYGDYRGKRK